ncbi:PAS domain S-box protein [Marinifilum sp. N1E240]|uniref:ATP-binding protein n=1 Tax=Marinifilum sp. N1E240 TaxID=2608082 RepID=UPI00128E0863|nr:ATP-binding protein [Marinifilum sp. N1E240]MPQ47694.1 PAS domain S-box protein [Marinifilum sp. N1E240]
MTSKLKNNLNKSIAPKDISNRFFFSLLLIILIFTTVFVYTYKKNTDKLNEDHLQQSKEQIIQAKKDYLKAVVDRTISEIELIEKMHLQLNNNPDESTYKLIKEQAKAFIRNTILQDSGYIWVDEVISYNEGDKFAIRMVHPNLPETEGDTISTSTKDIKGNTFYLTELEGVKRYGELYFSYWFKHFGNNKISQKLSYAKLYKKYNWIIASGVYLDDVDEFIASETSKSVLITTEHNKLAVIIALTTILLSIISALFYRKRITNILKFYMNKVHERENALKEINLSLENIVEERSRQLSESEKRYQVIFRNNQSIMMLLNPSNGDILDANDAALNFYGYSLDEITSINISKINTLSKKEVELAIHETNKSGSKYFLFKHRLSNGKIKDVEVYTERMTINSKEVFFSIIHDISKLRKTQQELLIAKKKAEESDQLKTAFLANMSHEIRSPLNSILGFTDLLSGSNISIDQKSRFTQIINNSGEQLMRIIDDIIDISHIESNQLTLSISSISINNSLEEIVTGFKNSRMTSKNKNIDLYLQIPNKKIDYKIKTDEVRFTQICNNLLNNAYKFTEKGSIEIGYTLGDSSQNKYLNFYVKDTGLGIPKNKFNLIFDRFSQVSHNDYREGNGLGLSITKGLVQLLGGEINVESTLGKGTTFYFTIPITYKSQKQEKVDSDYV